MKEKSKERLNISEYGVFEETGRLRKVMMWGQPGPETVIAQILPTDKSCFLENFSVVGARREFQEAVEIIKGQGVEVIQVKDLYAQMIDDQKIEPVLKVDQLKNALMEKALGFSTKYPDGYTGELEYISDMIDVDCHKYGERAAIVMNERLSLSSKYPMANVLYTRDQSNVAGGTWIWSSMRHEIRQPEVALYKEILTHAGIVNRKNFENEVQVSGNGRFEGGDGIAHGGFYYIGLGGRTNLEGIMQIAPAVLSQGLRLVVFRDAKRDKGLDNEMAAMHLDTIWMPSDMKKVVSCGNETARRTAFEICQGKEGLTFERSEKMDDHIRSLGIDVIPLSSAEQEAFAPNFLNIGNGTVILSIVDGNSVNQTAGEKTIDTKLKETGKTVLNANLFQITRGYGGLHCMTASIKRD